MNPTITFTKSETGVYQELYRIFYASKANEIDGIALHNFQKSCMGWAPYLAFDTQFKVELQPAEPSWIA